MYRSSSHTQQFTMKIVTCTIFISKLTIVLWNILIFQNYASGALVSLLSFCAVVSQSYCFQLDNYVSLAFNLVPRMTHPADSRQNLKTVI